MLFGTPSSRWMSVELTINPFDPASVQAALDALKEYKKSLDKKQERLISKALVKGADVANQIYAQHPGDHGVAHASADVKGNTGKLTATAPHDEIGFIEFGTGIRHREWQGASGVSFTPPPHGSYGKHLGGDPGYWFYDGKYTDGTDPAEAMLWARQAIIESVLDDAREVFRT